MVEEAVAHGVAPLLYRALQDARVWDRIAPDAKVRLAQIARESVLVESVRSEHLLRTIAALDAEGVRPLLFKGAALAVTHYPEPWLRTRSDSDLLVRVDEAGRTRVLLERLGFTQVPRPRGALITQQARYEGTAQGVRLAYDVHWRISDPHAFAAALPYEDLERRAIAGHPSGARTVSNVDALAIACVHRAAHHYDTDHLLFIYDIWLIARAFREDQWMEFAGIAERRRLRSVFRRALELAADHFRLEVPPAVQQALSGGDLEPTGIFVRRGLRKVDVLVSDLRSLTAWGDRFQLFKSHLFPGSSYLSASSPAGARLAFPFIRVIRGARKWWRPL